MAILITGSTGYIGSLLAQKLVAQGEELHLLCRTEPQIPGLQLPSVKIFKGDITDPESLRKASVGVNQVYHLAGYARLWAKDPSIFETINVKGTENVLRAATDAGVSKMVYTSTAGVIGPSKEKPMTESDPRIAGFFNEYEETKTRAESIVGDYAKQGLNVSTVSPARVYGPGLDTGSNPVTKIVELYMRGKWHFIPGSGEDIGSYCYIDDVVNGHVQAMERGGHGERYIFGGVNASFNELMSMLAKLTGRRKKLWHLPFPLIKAFSYSQVGINKLTGRPPMITPNWVKRYDYNWELDSSKAVRELGYGIRPLEQGLQETIDWVKRNRL